jgi:hypothetical protein
MTGLKKQLSSIDKKLAVAHKEVADALAVYYEKLKVETDLNRERSRLLSQIKTEKATKSLSVEKQTILFALTSEEKAILLGNIRLCACDYPWLLQKGFVKTDGKSFQVTEFGEIAQITIRQEKF